ncbi:MAG TPA: protocatechuate 3,4-dioxygenase [Stellaceae bacterium]|nr:protocatechuate 3,4-dioxygenase [Stellaceae bacterium]
MNEPGMVHRRSMLKTVAAIGVVSALPEVTRALAQTPLRRTPDQILGPFYPLGKTPDPGGDLTHLPGKPGRATGQILNVMGRVLNVKGEPVRRARLEIWQANAAGRYTHPADTNPAPLDLNFEGFAVLTTDAEGRYHFKTVQPGAYPAAPGLIRPPHIHFDVRGEADVLITQMYFAGEPENDKDWFLQSLPAPAQRRLTVELLPPPQELEAESKLAVFDIVLNRG